MDRTRAALDRIANEDPELAARLFVQVLPAAAQKLEGPLRYDLMIDGLGSWRVNAPENGHAATVHSVPQEQVGRDGADFTLSTDSLGIAALAAGESPVKLMLAGRLRVRGRRRKAFKLRALAEGEEPTIEAALAAGAELDTEAIFRTLPYTIDPEWTRGHDFSVAYEIEGEGTWTVHIASGQQPRVTRGAPDGPDATLRLSSDTYRQLVSMQLTPNDAMRRQLIHVEGELHPVTLLGRWIDRGQGRDDAELEREGSQRQTQDRRAGSWGARRDESGDLMTYEQLYALWERQNWRAHELDFSVDREQWLAAPADAQQDMLWSLGSFYIGEERVTADLAPFVMAAPSGEVEAFLATQLVDEMRHAVFFDRFGAEVLALQSNDLRGRLKELQARMERPWFDVFDDGLRDIANRIKERPDDLGLFVEGITTYHLIIEGVLAMTGQRFILKYTEDHGLYPGFHKGFSLVEQDEHRHIAFGVRFLKDMVASDSRYGDIVKRRVEELVPKAAHVFCPPYVDDPAEFVSYGYHSSQIYGFAYRKLKRRMALLGLDVPPPEVLMPGPIASPEEARAAGAPV